MTTTRAVHLGTMEEREYTLPPTEAVIAAHAQGLGDYNTWDYSKYRSLLVKTARTVACGDWCAIS